MRAALARDMEIIMAKGQMRSNKEKKKPKADKNIKKGGATPSPFAKPPMSSPPGGKKT
jgi:hypothetical protein